MPRSAIAVVLTVTDALRSPAIGWNRTLMSRRRKSGVGVRHHLHHHSRRLAYLAVVLDLFSRQVVGWSMNSRMARELAINALLMAVWRRNPASPVIVHSDQGRQYSSHDWQAFLKANNLEASMNRHGNCYDNAVAESSFQLLKRERIHRKIYIDRDEARRDVFNYIEMFYNAIRRHRYAGNVSPVEFENQYFNWQQSV